MRCSIAIFASMLLLVATEGRAQQLHRRSDQRSKTSKYQRGRNKPDQTEAKAKKAYHIPFNSHGNTIRMEVANGTSGPAKKLKLTVQDIPGWMQLTPASLSIEKLAAGKHTTSSFRFSVSKEAPVGKKATLRFVAKGVGGYHNEKKIALSVNPPTKLTLNPNYPNPFNPSTTIAYKLPARMQVKVTVFDVLGRRVATLADETQTAGLQELRWDASRYASGLYFYRIIAGGQDQQKIVRNKKMMLVK